MVACSSAPPRRYELLAYMLARGQRGESCPSIDDIARALAIGATRAKQLRDQLVGEGLIAKTPGAQRNLFIRDVARARTLVVQHLQASGAVVAQPMGQLLYPCPNGQLQIMPPLEHLPDPD